MFETPGVDAGQSVVESAAENGQLGHARQNDAARQRRPDHCDDTGDAGQNTGHLAPGQLLVIGEKVRQNHHENRRSGIENRGGAAVDELLRPADHVKWQTRVDDTKKADRQP